uniref:NADH-ubiquinone oxidoreductase chain 5 n=1 Tax=Chelonarium sp. BMNH 840450 TaxID=1903803 RepID=A0A343A3J1_9COLE|nr:NADH dehydrogenase subunit 5 [Chelonarium sp. BMNH 840450]
MFSLIFFFLSIYFVILNYTLMIELELLSLNSSSFFVSFIFDWMAFLFLSFVFFISCMVILYSDDYMMGDLNIGRFIILVFLFVLSMAFLIISPNLISILLGWDGLGLVSYCLVVYYQNLKSYSAGMLTALSNRIGDVALLFSIAWIFNYGSWNYLFYMWFLDDFSMKIVAFFIVIASMTKSAQIPFSAWLPAAMAAPTPVSSLVHSSTLVTAGIYLMIRFSLLMNVNLMLFVFFISSMTMFMAGLSANYEFDLKKIIALSTLSQLGLMMSILSLGESLLAFFHLLTHAVFKALLFMCAGFMIHSLINCQDIRFMGSFVNYMPLTCCFFLVSNMALCGIPFLSGFYSKDLVLEVLSMSYMSMYIYFIYFFSIGLTVCYTFRLIYYSVLDTFNFIVFYNFSEFSYRMIYGMLGLVILVVFGGSMLSWLIFPIPYFICLPFFIKLLTLFIILLGSWLGLLFSKFSVNYYGFSMGMMNLSRFFSSMWNLPIISTFGLNYYFVYLGGFYCKFVDQGWSEYFGSQNVFNLMVDSSLFFSSLFSKGLKVFLLMVFFWFFYLVMFI